jgi:hypothetical protein
MSSPSDADLAALEEAGPLLRFAAEHVKDLDAGICLAIAQAVDAQASNQWSPEISQRFWISFGKLCDLIKPVTMDGLLTKRRENLTRKRFIFWSKNVQTSLAERTSSQYVSMLMLVLVLIIPLQLYVWVATNIIKQTDDLLKEAATKSGQLTDEYIQLNGRTRGPDGSTRQLNTEESSAADRIARSAESLSTIADRIEYNSSLLDQLSLSAYVGEQQPPLKDVKPQWTEKYEVTTRKVDDVQIHALLAEENSNLIVGIMVSFFLPILFGSLGALAYVIRLISDQIRTTTFLQSSPIRHLMRVMLGALMGVVVGLFSGLSGQLSLPPLALAFLAGYGVEAVFSMFDGMIERFRQPGRGTTTPPAATSSQVGVGAGSLAVG